MSIKSLLRYPVDFPRAKRLVGESSEPGEASPVVVIALSNESMLIDLGRHLASLAISADRGGHRVMLVCRKRILAAMARKKYGREFLAMPHVTWIEPRHTAALESECPGVSVSLVLTDADSTNPNAHWMQLGRDVSVAHPVMPYPMHPSVAAITDEAALKVFRDHERTVRVFFAGNQKASYGDENLRRDFDVMSRIEVVATVANAFGDQIAASIAESDRGRPIVLSDSRVNPISTADWLSAIASSDFFLCPPGASQPLCHNFSEAIAVGTIPILEYGERVSPHLIDGTNALFFRGPGGLQQAIGRALSMTKNEIQTLRRGAIDFYRDHYRHESFLMDLIGRRASESSASKSPSSCRRVSLPFHHRNLFSDSGRDGDALSSINRAA